MGQREGQRPKGVLLDMHSPSWVTQEQYFTVLTGWDKSRQIQYQEKEPVW